MCELDLRPIPPTWLGAAEVLRLDDGPFEKAVGDCLDSEEGEVCLENNVGKVMCLLTKGNSIS